VNQAQLYQVIRAGHTTEKTVRIGDKHQQFAFLVDLNATKPQIKEAVEKLFSVKVKFVRVVNISGKAKRFKQREGHRDSVRKAYVALEAGHDINLADFE